MSDSGKTDVPGGFLVDAERLRGRIYVLTEAWREAYLEVLRSEDVVGIRLSESAGWPVQDPGFLSRLPALRSIEIYAWSLKDLSALYEQPQVEVLNLQCQFKRLDFARFRYLRDLGLRWRPGAETLFQCPGIEYLNVDGFPYEDLQHLRKLERLSVLLLQSRKLRCLSGIERCRRLSRLDLAFCTTLDDISDLSGLPNLEEVALVSCRKVSDISALGDITGLRKLLLEQCGEIDTIKPLAGCRGLEEVLLVGTSVRDGDLTPLLNLPMLRNVAVARKRHHSHTVEQIREMIGA